jgi:hypothetical protein
MKDQILDDFRLVWQEITGQTIDWPLEKLIEHFAIGVKLPRARRDVLNQDIVYSSDNVNKIIGQTSTQKLVARDGFVFETEEITSLDGLRPLVERISFWRGDKNLNVHNCQKSDNIYNSSDIYLSNNVFGSKNIGFSAYVMRCEYVFGSRDIVDSSFCIRVQDSKLLTNCYETSWSARCSNCLFIHSCTDMHDSMFCFQLTSRQYCIANRQYSREEYEEIRMGIMKELREKDYRVDFYPVV